MPYMQNYARKMKIIISSKPVDSLTCEGLALGIFADERPPRGYCGFVDWRLNGIISRYIAQGTITGAFMEKTLITANQRIPSSKIVLFGLGESAQVTYDHLYTAGQTISTTITEINCTSSAFDIPGPNRCSLDVSEMTAAMISGFADAFFASDEGNDDLCMSILGDDTYRDEITLGANQFKVNVKNKIKVAIIEA